MNVYIIYYIEARKYSNWTPEIRFFSFCFFLHFWFCFLHYSLITPSLSSLILLHCSQFYLPFLHLLSLSLSYSLFSLLLSLLSLSLILTLVPLLLSLLSLLLSPISYSLFSLVPFLSPLITLCLPLSNLSLFSCSCPPFLSPLLLIIFTHVLLPLTLHLPSLFSSLPLIHYSHSCPSLLSSSWHIWLFSLFLWLPLHLSRLFLMLITLSSLVPSPYIFLPPSPPPSFWPSSYSLL